MTDDDTRPRRKSGMFSREYKSKRLRIWLVPLLIVVAVIIFLPRLLALLE